MRILNDFATFSKRKRYIGLHIYELANRLTEIHILTVTHIYRGLAVVVKGKGANLFMVAKQKNIVQLTKGSFFVFVDSFEKLPPPPFSYQLIYPYITIHT